MPVSTQKDPETGQATNQALDKTKRSRPIIDLSLGTFYIYSSALQRQVMKNCRRVGITTPGILDRIRIKRFKFWEWGRWTHVLGQKFGMNDLHTGTSLIN